MKLSPESDVPKDEYHLPDGSKVVRLEILGKCKDYPQEERNRNVFLVDRQGGIIWRVAFHECAHGDDPFVGIELTKEGAITGLTWDGWRFEIDRADGSLKMLGWTKS